MNHKATTASTAKFHHIFLPSNMTELHIFTIPQLAQLHFPDKNDHDLNSISMIPINIYPLVFFHSLLLKMAIEIVDLPIKNDGFPRPTHRSSSPGGPQENASASFGRISTASRENDAELLHLSASILYLYHIYIILYYIILYVYIYISYIIYIYHILDRRYM